MPFYMFEGRYTSAAFKAMIETPQDREAAARALVESVGGTLHHVFFALGREDVIAICEAPDDESMAAGAMILAASGAFSGGRTTKLLTPAEAKDAMARAAAAAGAYRPVTG